MKKTIAILLSFLLCLGALSGCGGTAAPSTTGSENVGEGSSAGLPANSGELVTIRVGASITPHSEILQAANKLLEEKGYTLDIVEFDDYILPNLNVESGELDANFFQHRPYLENFNEENNTHLVPVAIIHYEPFGLYPGKTTSLDALADGAQVAVPNDGTNEARALLLLESLGLITLKEGVGTTATILDIAENPKNLQITEMAAAQLARSLQDVDMAVINGNYALQAGLDLNNALATEDKESEIADTYANVLVVKEDNEKMEAIQALAEALTSPEIKEFIDKTYNGIFLPLF
ncbi:MAG: MetQ/NlpA family ABC transporter substrate-binding protein [Oscillospiraceae bacterium]|nr:MetQ/NlpA family ABC transporter substrate-binding protein [Oscillospiraceae bacterium]